MTDVEYRSQFSLWAIMAAPLLAGNDIRTMSAYTRQTLTNRDVIAVDQDPRGVQGRVVWKNPSNDLQVWAKPLARQPDGSYARAVVLFNRMYNKKDITVTWADLGLTAGTITAVRDLWSGQDVPLQTSQNRTGYTQTGYTTSVVQHGVVVLKVVATQQPPCSPGTGTAWLLC
jgi:alpha-galactosidase